MGGDGDPFTDGGAESEKVCREPKWSGALDQARKLHRKYVAALEEYVQFQEANDDKVLLWNLIRELLVQSRERDGVDTGALFEALGMEPPGGASIKWTLENQLRIRSAVEMLAGGQDTQRVLVSQNVRFRPEATFVRFGRAYVYRQAAVTIRAYQLITFLNTGTKDTSITSVEQAFELGPADLTRENTFYMEFKESSYDEQVRIVNRLITDLDKCDVGREFLADLFEHRREAIFDPFGFVPPLPAAWENFGYFGLMQNEPGLIGLSPAECVEEETVSVSVKHPDELKQYYTPDFRLRLSESSPAAESFATHLVSLISKLQAGLGYFYATRIQDKDYMDGLDSDDEHPQQVYIEFAIGVFSLFTNDDHMRAEIERIWGDDEEFEWDEDAFETFRTTGELSPNTTMKFFATAAAGGETFLDMHKLPGASFATTLKGTLSVLISFQVLIDLHNVGRLTDAQTVGAILDVTSGFNDLLGVVALRAKRLGPLVSFLGVALNGFAALFSYAQMAETFREGDDAWIGHGMMGVGLTIFTGFSLVKLSGLTTSTVGALGIGSFAIGALLAVGVVLVAIGLIVVLIRSDGPITRWLRKTYFGDRWVTPQSNLRVYADPWKNPDTYGYAEFLGPGPGGLFLLGEPNFVRQASGLSSTVRPIDIMRVDIGMEKRNGEKRLRGHILVEPEEAQLLADGYLYLRPLEIYRSSGHPKADLRMADFPTDTCLHRFSLADGPGDEKLQSRTNLEAAFPDQKAKLKELGLNWALEAIEEHKEGEFSSEDLDLEIVNVVREENDDGEVGVTKWEVKVWDMSGFGFERIFGYSKAKLAGRPRCFVELIYVPPSLTQTMEANGTLWFRPERLPVVSREIAQIFHASGGLSE